MAAGWAYACTTSELQEKYNLPEMRNRVAATIEASVDKVKRVFYLSEIMVDVPVRKQGYATKITQSFLAKAQELGLNLVMRTLSVSHMDERETAHEALAERNAAWTMVVILTGAVIFQSTFSALQGHFYVDPFIVTALLGGVVAKSISSWYYSDK